MLSKDIMITKDEINQYAFMLPDNNGMLNVLFKCTECTVECLLEGEDEVFVHYYCDYCDRTHYVSKNDIETILS